MWNSSRQRLYEGHLESKESFAIKKYLLIIKKEKGYAGFITHLHLLLHIVTLDIEALVVPWHQFTYSLLVPDCRLAIQPVHDSVLQVLIICMSFTSKVLLHLQEEVKVRWGQVRTVWRMVECVPMEFITQPGLCQPGGMCPDCIQFGHGTIGLSPLLKMKEHLARKRHADDEDLQHAFVDWLNSQAAVWYCTRRE